MAKGASAKSKAASRGRGRLATRRKTAKPARQSRDTRSRSAASDARRARKKRGVNPRARRSGRPGTAAVSKNRRQRSGARG